MTTNTIDNTQDIIDIRDIITRFEDLTSQREDLMTSLEENAEAYDYHDSDDTKSTPEWSDLVNARNLVAEWDASEEAEELKQLTDILEDLAGNGGDEQFNGDWYPITLIRESHFQDYAQELAEDCGMIPADAQWPNNCIDWEQAARELRYDYTSTEINGVTYFYR